MLALGEANRILLRNQSDIFLVGGADSKLNPLSQVRQQLFGYLEPNLLFLVAHASRMNKWQRDFADRLYSRCPACGSDHVYTVDEEGFVPSAQK